RVRLSLRQRRHRRPRRRVWPAGGQGQRRRFLCRPRGRLRGGRTRPQRRRAERHRGRYLPLLRPPFGRRAALSRQGRGQRAAREPRLPQAFPHPRRRGGTIGAGCARRGRCRGRRADGPRGRQRPSGRAARPGAAADRRVRVVLGGWTMPQKSIRQALNEAIAQEMRRDPTIIVIGEDVSGGAGSEGQRDAYGGVLGVTKGLIGEFGEARVIDTPITESAIMGAAAGAAVTGLRPVAELMFSDFFGVCFDQIFNQAAKFRYMFGGKAKTPLVIRTMIGAGRSAAAQHSQSPYHIFTSVPGLKVVVPSNAYDAKGLLIQAISDDDPVIFCEHKLMYDLRAEVPDEPYTIPFGEANIVRDGDDVTVVT